MASVDLKFLVMGNCFTGKTNFVNKYTKNIFNNSYKHTIVSEFAYKVFEKDNKKYRLQIWDLSGDDKNGMVTRIFVEGSHGCIIFSDATKISTRKE